MISLWGAIRAEILKLKLSGIFWLTSVGTIFTNILFALAAWYLPGLSDQITFTPLSDWNSWLDFHYLGILPMLLPMYMVILCALSVLAENRSSMWKILYSLSISKSMVYYSKLKVIFWVFALSHFLFVILLLIIPGFLGLSDNTNSIPVGYALELYIATIVSSLSTLGLVYLVSYFSRGLVLPLAVGILGFVTAQLMRDNGFETILFPFSHPVLGVESLLNGLGHRPDVYLNSLIQLGIFTAIGSYLATRDYWKFKY